MQDCSNSSASAMKLPQSCTKPSILPFAMLHYFTHHVPERWRQDSYGWQISMIFHLKELNFKKLILQYFSIILALYIIGQYFNLLFTRCFDHSDLPSSATPICVSRMKMINECCHLNASLCIIFQCFIVISLRSHWRKMLLNLDW